MPKNQQPLDLFIEEKPIYEQYLPTITQISNGGYAVNEWDVPYSISKLSYLVHSDYRYYGKFPSVIAGQILHQFPPPTAEHYVLDNFCGSGTTLVEAKLRGIRSYGVDISWLSVLASNVKTRINPTKEIQKELLKLASWFEANQNNYSAPEDAFARKWFEDNAARDLKVIQDYIQKMDVSSTRDFLLVAFIGIVRRVSKAYDAEVRPHIKKDKKQREVISAFAKKVNDMCKDHAEYAQYVNEDTASLCFMADNTSLDEIFNDNKCYLVISHPPYLNSFNYAPVYSLEFYWGKIFEPEYTDSKTEFYKQEMRAHPASEIITERYFAHLRGCYEETYRIQPQGAYLAVVIGDCTRNKKLIRVLDETVKIVEEIGYDLIEMNYRTTHYGLGKYAYRHRADYHGEEEEKRDGVMIFKKK